MKAISTFVAIIITVLITVSVGLLLYGWATGYLRTTTETTQGTQQEIVECSKGRIDVSFSKSANGNLEVTLANLGLPNIGENFLIRVEFEDGTSTTLKQTFNINDPGDIYTKDLGINSGTVTRVSVRPLDKCTFLEFSATGRVQLGGEMIAH